MIPPPIPPNSLYNHRMKYFGRDESWLGFNERVLNEATNTRLPVYERIKFLSIYSSNLDEFFSVRYPVIMAAKKVTGEAYVQGLYERIRNQLETYGTILQQQLLPALRDAGIHLYYKEPFAAEHLSVIREKFYTSILSFLRPIFLYNGDASRFTPDNDQLYLIADLESESDGGRHLAVVNIPSRETSRFIELPQTGADSMQSIAFLDDIIRENLYCLFPGNKVHGAYSFKLTRNADLELEDEFTGNMLKKLEANVSKRKTGMPSRLLYESAMPDPIRRELRLTFGLKKEELFPGGRYHNLKDLMKLPDFGKPVKAAPMPVLQVNSNWECGNIFDAIAQKDILIHLPYQSYNPVLALFNQAAIHPDTKEIYLTIYRIAANSHIANALISAAQNGKKVTAVVELKARFDEENNIAWSKKLKKAGVRLVYSHASIKVHSKTALIRMNSNGVKKDYCIISTGNFNEETARFYTDHVLLTANKTFAAELVQLFRYLSGREGVSKAAIHFQTLLVAGFNMIPVFDQYIGREVRKAKQGQKARIRIKMNALEEKDMIRKLYDAAAAGVEVQLIVRGICCLVPGQLPDPGKITVKRIVGRYLEHSRLFIFGDDTDASVFMGSSDWMYRNLHKRIEVCCPVLDPHCRQQLLDYFNLQWKDQHRAVLIGPDNQNHFYEHQDPQSDAQAAIYHYLDQLHTIG